MDHAPASFGHAAVGGGQEVRRHRRRGRGRGGGHVHRCGLGHGTLVSRTTETLDVLLVASEYWRRTTLLQADYVTSETETEIARVVPGHLLRRNVHFASVSEKGNAHG